jgi:hypothetical protein
MEHPSRVGRLQLFAIVTCVGQTLDYSVNTMVQLGSGLINLIHSVALILVLRRRNAAVNQAIFKAFQRSQGQNQRRPEGLTTSIHLKQASARKGPDLPLRPSCSI